MQDEISELKYGDAYERFRTDIYKVDGQTAEDENVGGIGMALKDTKSVQKYVDNLKAQGYDGIIIKGTNYDADTMGGINDQYVAFYPEQIKNVDNLNPTNNPRIDRSISSSYGGYNKISNDAKKIGSSNVAPIDTETLPGGYEKMRDYLSDYKNIVPKAIGKPASKVTKADLVKLLEEYGYDTEGTKWELWNTAQDLLEDQLVDELYEENDDVYYEFPEKYCPVCQGESISRYDIISYAKKKGLVEEMKALINKKGYERFRKEFL